jgi:DoxX-like protein
MENVINARRWIYWGVTGLTGAFMLSSSIPDLLQIPQAIVVFQHLGYPQYLLVFLGLAKTLGVAVLLLPWDSRVKEWAFAGLVIDVTGALYSHLSVGDPFNVWLPAGIGLVLLSSSYLAYRTHY